MENSNLWNVCVCKIRNHRNQKCVVYITGKSCLIKAWFWGHYSTRWNTSLFDQDSTAPIVDIRVGQGQTTDTKDVLAESGGFQVDIYKELGLPMIHSKDFRCHACISCYRIHSHRQLPLISKLLAHKNRWHRWLLYQNICVWGQILSPSLCTNFMSCSGSVHYC